MKRQFTVESSRTMVASKYVNAGQWDMYDVSQMLYMVQKKFGKNSEEAKSFQKMIDDDVNINRLDKRFESLMKQDAY